MEEVYVWQEKFKQKIVWSKKIKEVRDQKIEKIKSQCLDLYKSEDVEDFIGIFCNECYF